MPQTIGLDPDDSIPSIRAKLEAAGGEPLELVVPDGLDVLRSPVAMRLLARHLRRSGLTASIRTHDDVVRGLARSEGIALGSRGGSVSGKRTPQRKPSGAGPPSWFALRRMSAPRPAPAVAWLAGTALAVVMFGAAGLLFLPSATITFRPVPQVTDEILTVTASSLAGVADPRKLVIPGRSLQTDIAVTQKVTVRTTQKVPDAKATGRVTFTNLTGTALELPARSRVGTPEGFAFETGAAATLSAGEKRAVSVTAVEGGEEGNLDARAVSVVREPSLAGRVTVENETPLNGGTTVERLVVRDEDVAQQRQNAVDTARREAADRIRKSLPPDVSFYDESVRLVIQHDGIQRDVGSDSIDLTVSVQGVAMVLGFVGRDLNQMIARHLADRGQGLEPDGHGIQLRVLGLADSSNDSIAFHTQVAAGFRPKMAPDEVRAAVKGKTPGEAVAALTARYPLAGAPEIETWPFWVAAVPGASWRIDVR
ncbi:MAG: hypothetical protein EXR51_11125 [Dehalococcoidia bacterium]|nr:hypothetical protein [Dehalococcoidia bacterium]